MKSYVLVIKQRKIAILIRSYQGYILSTYFMTVDVNLDQLGEVPVVRFLHCEVFLLSLPLSILYSEEGSHYVQPTLEWGIMFHHLGKEYMLKSFQILSVHFVHSSHLLVYSIIYIRIDSWISILILIFIKFLLKFFQL